MNRHDGSGRGAVLHGGHLGLAIDGSFVTSARRSAWAERFPDGGVTLAFEPLALLWTEGFNAPVFELKLVLDGIDHAEDFSEFIGVDSKPRNCARSS
jgi:hypothetical protein